MKQKPQLFPSLIDSMGKIKSHFSSMNELEDIDKATLDFINLAQNHFDFKNAVSFKLPKNLEKISDMFDGMTNEEIIRNFIPNTQLPFPTISIELEYDFQSKTNELYKIKDLVIVAENRMVDGKPFIDAMFSYGVERLAANGKKLGGIIKPIELITRFSTDPTLSDKEWIHNVVGEPTEENIECLTSCFSTLLFLLSTLSCHNVEIAKDFPPSIVDNRKRVKKGFAPYKQLHFIVIKQSEKKTGANAAKGSHTPKATHVRRGHIRNYENKRVWIEATIINGGVGEVKPKDYILK